MKYRLFNGPNRVFHRGDTVPDLQYNGSVVMAIDPSKTNCAVVIGDTEGYVISILEMSGNNWSRGPAEDTTEYCSEVKEFITRWLDGVPICTAGLEKAITKKGMEHHMSNMVLTEIRATFLNYFWEVHGLHKTDVEVNNWTWKRAILPEGYRSQSEKGSIRYFAQYLQDHTYDDYYEADVTDCMCIYKYLLQAIQPRPIACQGIEKARRQFTYALLPTWTDELGFRKFLYNPAFDLHANATYFANRSFVNGIAAIPVEHLSIDDIYKYSGMFNDISQTGSANLVVYAGDS